MKQDSNIIRLGAFMSEMIALRSFYHYSTFAFEDEGKRDEIIKFETTDMLMTMLPFMQSEQGISEDAEEILKLEIEKKVHSEVENGLAVLRRQIIVAAHSIFERYLCHVVRTFYHAFPRLLMEIDKSVPFKVIGDLRDNNAIFDYAVEVEVNKFAWKGMQEKKDYLRKYLKQTHHEEIWKYDGEELWKDIDCKRKEIVHDEEILDIPFDYLVRAINCFDKIMLWTAMYAQIDQGVKFEWGNLSEYLKSQNGPRIR